MSKADNDQYDAVIIGAGIGGLVCGCYLAKAGMKVLIAEQHHKPGGYCTSFRRGKYLFDAGPHCFGSYREGGILRKILHGLAVDERLSVLRADPSDTIVAPDHTLSFWNDRTRTIQEFQQAFPKEREAIRKFFQLLLDTDPGSFAPLRKATLQQVLDLHFTDDRLKAIIAMPLMGVHGLPSSRISAFVAAKLYSEFLFDGGYAPVGGMQQLPEVLAARFREFGGEMRLSARVMRIRARGDRVTGIVLEDGSFIRSHWMISNGDARQTFLALLGSRTRLESLRHEVRGMVPTVSNFIVYLGLAQDCPLSLVPGTFYYYFGDYDVEGAYQAIVRGDHDAYSGFAIRVAFDRSTIYAGRPEVYRRPSYWRARKQQMLERIVAYADRRAIPGLSRYILCKEAATPHTLQRYTLNYHGAAYGWAGIPSQIIRSDFRKPSALANLYCTGHWTTFGVGVSGVAYTGFETANSVLKKYNSNRAAEL